MTAHSVTRASHHPHRSPMRKPTTSGRLLPMPSPPHTEHVVLGFAQTLLRGLRRQVQQDRAREARRACRTAVQRSLDRD